MKVENTYMITNTICNETGDAIITITQFKGNPRWLNMYKYDEYGDAIITLKHKYRNPK